MNLKKIIWNEKAKEFVRNLEHETRKEIGTLLMILQKGGILGEPQSKPLKILSKGAFELRIRDRYGIYRIIYILILKDKIIIPHCFKKKTQKIPEKEIDISKRRLKEMLYENQ